MEKIKIIFDNTDYSIEQSSLDAIDDNLKTHLSTAMKGSGAVINMGDTAYDVDSTKLANAAAAFVAHLGLIAGEGSKVVVNGTEYAIGSDKVEGAIDNLHIVLGSLSSGESGGDDVVTVAAGLYETGSNYTVLVKDWDTLVNEDVVSVTDGAVKAGSSGTSGLVGDLALPNDGSVTALANYTFYGCRTLTGIIIPDSVTSIVDYAFYNCAFTSITIPDSVTTIGANAFKNCYNLTSVTIPDSVTSIGGSAFNNCDSLTSITIPDSVTFIGDQAFSQCDNLESITMPDGITSILYGMFSNCKKLTDVTFPNDVTSIGDYAFQRCGFTSMIIPESVTKIGGYAFSTCENLASVTLSDNVASIGNYAFVDCNNLMNIFAPDGNQTYCDIDGVLFDKSKETIMLCPPGKTSDYVIPDNVINIANIAFNSCKNLTSVTMPDSVTNIGQYAFSGCTRLTSVTISNNVTNIDKGAFQNCTALTSIVIPSGVTNIGEQAFYNCKKLTSFSFGGTIAEWNAIVKGSSWKSNVPATEVVCTDGTVTL